MTKKEYWYWLCHIDGLGSVRIKKLLDYFEEPEGIFRAGKTEMEACKILPSRLVESWYTAKKGAHKIVSGMERLSQRGITFLSRDDPNYPERLKEIYDPPCGLYVKGSMETFHRPCAAIVGARQCTEYGREAARYFGRVLANAGFSIVSGMAVGIDAAGHRGALDGSHSTFAVLASNVDVCYPRENIGMYMEIQKRGAILSEFDGQKVVPGLFPLRNRIISGMADCVLVIEAREKSGSLITADLALDQGREVFALPGRICDPISSGCNELIKSGAQILTKPEDILSCFHMEDKKNLNQTLKKEALSSMEEFVLGYLGPEEKHVEQLLYETGLPISALMEALLQLEIKNYVRQPAKNYYSFIKFS